MTQKTLDNILAERKKKKKKDAELGKGYASTVPALLGWFNVDHPSEVEVHELDHEEPLFETEPSLHEVYEAICIRESKLREELRKISKLKDNMKVQLSEGAYMAPKLQAKNSDEGIVCEWEEWDDDGRTLVSKKRKGFRTRSSVEKFLQELQRRKKFHRFVRYG